MMLRLPGLRILGLRVRADFLCRDRILSADYNKSGIVRSEKTKPQSGQDRSENQHRPNFP